MSAENVRDQRRFRAPADEWKAFGQAAKAVHPEGRSPRSRVLRDFMRWYMRRPGAPIPKRPDSGPWSAESKEPAS